MASLRCTRGLHVSATDDEVGVFDAEARVVADTGQRHEASASVEHIEIRPVVEVSVGCGRPGQRRGRLMDRILVERAQVHKHSLKYDAHYIGTMMKS